MDEIEEREREATGHTVRDGRRSRATYLEQLSARVLRSAEKAMARQPAAFGRLSALIGELLIELRRSEESCEVLRGQLRAIGQRHADLLERIPIPCLITDSGGTIVEVNREALLLLNASERHTIGKPVVLWFRGRTEATAIVQRLGASPRSFHEHLQLMPRERRARAASLVVQEVLGVDPPLWRWFFLDCEPDDK